MADRDVPMTPPRAFSLALASLAALLLALVSACGGGPSVPACRTDATIEPPPPGPEAGLTLSVGSYEGTGSPQCIRGIGFQPVVVIVKGDTAGLAVWHSSSMEEDSTADFASGQHNIEGGITSLDSDAFSLGEDASVNAEGVAYYYVAFSDSPDIKVGSYFGDAADRRSIEDVGFEPVLVFLKWDGVRSAVWRSISHPEGTSSFFDGQADAGALIRAFEADGFLVGSDPWVNNDGGPDDPATYHFVAFREVPGGLATGSYVGDGSDDRDITDIGFQPDYLWIKRDSAQSKAVHRPSSLAGDSTLRFEGVPNASGEIRALLPDGFQVGSESAVNAEGDTYNYVAWKSSSGP